MTMNQKIIWIVLKVDDLSVKPDKNGRIEFTGNMDCLEYNEV